MDGSFSQSRHFNESPQPNRIDAEISLAQLLHQGDQQWHARPSDCHPQHNIDGVLVLHRQSHTQRRQHPRCNKDCSNDMRYWTAKPLRK